MIIQGRYHGLEGIDATWLQWRDTGVELALYAFFDHRAWMGYKKYYKATGVAFAITPTEVPPGVSYLAEVYVPYWEATRMTLTHEATHCADRCAQVFPGVMKRAREEVRAYMTEGISHVLWSWAQQDYSRAPDFTGKGLFKKNAGDVEYGLPGPTYDFSI